MPYAADPSAAIAAIIPPGYQAVLLGQAATVDGLGAFAPLEAGSEEGALFLARLELEDTPDDEVLASLEQSLADAGVERWPGHGFVVHASPGEPVVYLAWQKGLAWLPIIIGIVGITVLPPLVGGVVWWLMPQGLKDMISGIVNLGMMALVLYLVSKVMPKPSPPQKKREPRQIPAEPPKEVKEARA